VYVCVCINCVYLFIVFFFECVGVLPFDGEIKMYKMKISVVNFHNQMSDDTHDKLLIYSSTIKNVSNSSKWYSIRLI